MSPLVRSPWNLPLQGKAAGFEPGTRAIADCRNSRSTWLSPLLTTRSNAAYISLVAVQLGFCEQAVEQVPGTQPAARQLAILGLSGFWWATAYTFEISSLFGTEPVPNVSEGMGSPFVSPPTPV